MDFRTSDARRTVSHTGCRTPRYCAPGRPHTSAVNAFHRSYSQQNEQLTSKSQKAARGKRGAPGSKHCAMMCLPHGSANVPTHHPWLAPMGMERPEIPLKGESWVAPCGRALGRYAPVTHCADGYEQKYGHWWFYAAVGCSDMLADLGEKRLVARNRCHAAHLLSDYQGEWMAWYQREMGSRWVHRAKGSWHLPNFFERATTHEPNLTRALEMCVDGVFECDEGSGISLGAPTSVLRWQVSCGCASPYVYMLMFAHNTPPELCANARARCAIDRRT